MKPEAVQERAEERARGEPEPSFEVGDEDHPFPGFRGWLVLARGAPTFDAVGDSPSSPQPGELGIGHLGPFPSSALGFLDVVVRGMPRHNASRLQKARIAEVSSVQRRSEASKRSIDRTTNIYQELPEHETTHKGDLPRFSIKKKLELHQGIGLIDAAYLPRQLCYRGVHFPKYLSCRGIRVPNLLPRLDLLG